MRSRAGPVAALLTMGLVALDRILVYLAIHPYHNQIWGIFALAFTLLFAWRFVWNPTAARSRSWSTFGALSVFAYPLLAPFPPCSRSWPGSRSGAGDGPPGSRSGGWRR